MRINELRKRAYTTALLLIITLVIGGWASKNMSPAAIDYYYKVADNIKAFGSVYKEINSRYVEDLDPASFLQAGIDGMLNKLDPYTVYIEQEQTDELHIMTSGKYGGVGMRISKRNGWPTVADPPFEDTPAQRAHIREGDQIIEIDDQTTKDLTISETAHRLRGKKGTAVHLKVRREGFSDPLEFSLIRDEINPHDVAYIGFVKPGIGYIRLSHFGRNSIKEIQNGILDLKKEGLESLILDLRYNPGGLLDAAVSVADNFFDKGQLIVSTKGRLSSSNQKYVSKKKALLPDEPLVVLVSNMSASASEIVAGAVQDLDRGIIIGEQTFGKGLVQTVVRVNHNDALKITSAKYYTPSGRCIQKPDVFKRGKNSVYLDKEVITDSTKKETYKTNRGRLVYGDGGIKPDIAVVPRKGNRYLFELFSKSMFFNFALHHVADHPDLTKDFSVDDDVLAEFKSFLKEKEFAGKIEGEDEFEDFKKVLTEKKHLDEFSQELKAIELKLSKAKEKEFDKNKQYIKERLDYEIASKLWGLATATERAFAADSTILKATKILKNNQTYSKIISANGEVGNYVLEQ